MFCAFQKPCVFSHVLNVASRIPTDLQPGTPDARGIRLPERLRRAAVCPRHPSAPDPRGWARLALAPCFVHSFKRQFSFFLRYLPLCSSALSVIDLSFPLFLPKAPMKWWGWLYPEVCWQSHDERLFVNEVLVWPQSWPKCYGFVTVWLDFSNAISILGSSTKKLHCYKHCYKFVLSFSSLFVFILFFWVGK